MSFEPNSYAAHSETELTDIALKYRSTEFIADEVMPKAMVRHLSDKYRIYSKSNSLRVDDTRIGEDGYPNEVVSSYSEDMYKAFPYTLSNWVSMEELENDAYSFSLMRHAQEDLMDKLMRVNEVTVRDLVKDTSNYPAGNVLTLAGADRWDTATGDPIKDLQWAMRQVIGTPTVVVMGLEVWHALSRNRTVINTLLGPQYNGTVGGLVTPEMVSRALGLPRIVVGMAREDTSKIGQTESISYIWGKYVGVFAVPSAMMPYTYCWGKKFMWKDMSTRVLFNGFRGSLGGYRLSTTYHAAYKVTAEDAGVLINTVIS